MKKTVIFLLLLATVVLSSACKSDSIKDDTSKQAPELLSQEPAESIEDVSKEIGFVDRYYDEDKSCYVHNTYATDGTLLVQECFEVDGTLFEKSLYYSDGRKKLYYEYDEDGNTVGTGTFEYRGNSVTTVIVDADNELFSKTVTKYVGGKVAEKKGYDDKDVLTDEIIYFYAPSGKLVKTETRLYEGGRLKIRTSDRFDPATGKQQESNEEYFDASGKLMYTDRYGIKDGKYGFINRVAPDGKVLPVDD